MKKRKCVFNAYNGIVYKACLTVGKEYTQTATTVSNGLKYAQIADPDDGQGSLWCCDACFETEPMEGVSRRVGPSDLAITATKTEKHKCNCQMTVIMSVGCQCGGI